MSIRFALRVGPYAIGVAILATAVVGCYSLARVPARYISTEHPLQVFVRDAEGSIFSVSNPTIVKDSLVGTDEEGPIAVNLREVSAMAVRTLNKQKTFGAIGAAVGVVGMVTLGALKAAGGKGCIRVPNRNNMCIDEIAGCKYGGCNPDTL